MHTQTYRPTVKLPSHTTTFDTKKRNLKMKTKNVHAAIVVAFIAIVMLLSTLLPTPAMAAPVISSSCSTRNLEAKDLGNGNILDQGYVIDVYDIPRDDGFFVYYDHFAGGFKSVRWHPTNALSNGVRFGVSTSWAYTHPWWQETYWTYVYDC